jgi:hypothetical protein
MRILILMGALFLLGALVGRAGATDEYYTISDTLASAPCQGNQIPCSGNLTISGWFETNGFGKSNYGCGSGESNPVAWPGNSECPGYNPVLINSHLTVTYQGVSQWAFFPDGSFPYGVMATSKGLFCLKGCDIENTDASPSQVYFDINNGHEPASTTPGTAWWLVPIPLAPGEQLSFETTLPKNGLVATYAGTSVPTAAPEMDAIHAVSALTLLAGIGLVLQGRRR